MCWSQCNIPVEQRPQLHYSGSLKSFICHILCNIQNCKTFETNTDFTSSLLSTENCTLPGYYTATGGNYFTTAGCVVTYRSAVLNGQWTWCNIYICLQLLYKKWICVTTVLKIWTGNNELAGKFVFVKKIIWDDEYVLLQFQKFEPWISSLK
jgi:hypothetical protein